MAVLVPAGIPLAVTAYLVQDQLDDTIVLLNHDIVTHIRQA
jgi:hypothetical protein